MPKPDGSGGAVRTVLPFGAAAFPEVITCNPSWMWIFPLIGNTLKTKLSKFMRTFSCRRSSAYCGSRRGSEM
jgi:hypothetical protein